MQYQWLMPFLAALWLPAATFAASTPADATLDSSLIWTEPLLEEIIPQASDEVVPEAKAVASAPVERDLPTPRVAEGSWSVAAPLSLAMSINDAVKLSDGRVFVIGNKEYPQIYDPTIGIWSTATAPRPGYLPDIWNIIELPTSKLILALENDSRVSKMYTPFQDYWLTTANRQYRRIWFTATLLSNDRVLVAGGKTWNYSTLEYDYLYSTEVYTQNTGTWNYTGEMSTSRLSHTATLLANGKVLIVGGQGIIGDRNDAEIYDPMSSSWIQSGDYMATARKHHTATRLTNGKVLIAGGCESSYSCSIAGYSSELYDPASDTFTSTGYMTHRRSEATSTLLSNGKVLIVGGLGANSGAKLSSAEIYNPATGTWSDAGTMATPRISHSAALLSNGKVLVVGGYNTGDLSSVELYTPAVAKPDFMITAMTIAPVAPTANGTFTVTITVKNQGTGAGDGKFLDVWSHQPAAKACGAVGNKRVAVGAIAAGASKALTVTGLPAGIAGSKMLRSFVDSGCGTVESNDNNNQFTALYSVNQATGINFAVTSITLNPATPVRNGTFNAVVQVKNLGTVAGDGKFLDVWSNQPAGQVCGAVGNKRLAVGVLAAGAAKNLTFTGLAAGVAGAKTFRAFVDSGCGTGENNEGNNQLTKVYSVQ